MEWFNLHLMVDFIWAIFLFEFITSLKYDLKEKYLFGIFLIISLIVAIFIGIKLIIFYPDILKTSGWLHLKLTLLFLIVIEIVYLLYLLFKNKNIKPII